MPDQLFSLGRVMMTTNPAGRSVEEPIHPLEHTPLLAMKWPPENKIKRFSARAICFATMSHPKRQ